MKSNRAKVLHELGGSPLIAHVTRTAQALDPQRIIVVVGHQAEEVERAVLDAVGGLRVLSCRRNNAGRAMRSSPRAACSRTQNSLVLVLSGDVPMIKLETLKKLIEHHNNAGATCTILSVRLENPTGYGRVIRDESDAFQKIVEQRDATDEKRQVKEINSGIYCFDARELFKALRSVEPQNDQVSTI